MGPGWLLSVLVEPTWGQNRDERVLRLLAPKAERARIARGPRGRPGTRGDFAAGRFLVQNTLTACAELLHRNRGMAELRELGIG